MSVAYHNLIRFLLLHGTELDVIPVRRALEIVRKKRERLEPLHRYEEWHDLGGEA